jgi:hypothetical protein
MAYEDLLKHQPFALEPAQKDALLKAALAEAHEHHYENSLPYRRFCEKRGVGKEFRDFDYRDYPYFPVEIFKTMRLSSVEDAQIVRTLQSSATSSQTPSQVAIDNVTRIRQMKTLMWLLSARLGKQRRPFVMLDVDPNRIPPGQMTISARAAAIRGFLIGASSASYCMKAGKDGALEIDLDATHAALESAAKAEQPLVLFGYTYVLYAYVAKEFLERGVKFDLSQATVMHIGGWKKLQSQAVSKSVFNATLSEVFGVREKEIVDVYGFTEHLGVIYADGADGVKRCPLVSEIIVRDPQTLEPVPDGESGLVQFLTPLPYSYPGCSILLDDIGRILSREPSDDGRWGTSFEITGRAKDAEVRGCGDILSDQMTGVA